MTENNNQILPNIENETLIQMTIPEYITQQEKETQVFFLQNEFNTNLTDANENMRVLRERACSLIQETNLPDDFIHITHKIWLTNPNHPFEPNEHTQQLVKQQYINLPNYRHIFWTNVPEFCKNFILAWGVNNIEIRNIIEFREYYGYRVYEAFMNQDLFANACDVVKLQVVCKYGGIFSDMGWSLKTTLPMIIKNFNIIINGEFCEPGIVSHNILGSKITEHYLYTTILKKVDDIPTNIFYYERIKNIWGMIELCSPRMLTAAVSTICKDEKVLLIVNNEYTCDRYHNNSWFGEGKYGSNVHVNVDYPKLEKDLQII
jgi:mannosyltransferase OCH1-like enzyme